MGITDAFIHPYEPVAESATQLRFGFNKRLEVSARVVSTPSRQSNRWVALIPLLVKQGKADQTGSGARLSVGLGRQRDHLSRQRPDRKLPDRAAAREAGQHEHRTNERVTRHLEDLQALDCRAADVIRVGRGAEVALEE